MCQDLKGHELRNQNFLDLLTYKGVFALGVFFDKSDFLVKQKAGSVLVTNSSRGRILLL